MTGLVSGKWWPMSVPDMAPEEEDPLHICLPNETNIDSRNFVIVEAFIPLKNPL